MTQQFEIAHSDIVHEDFGGDLVILNLASGQYFGLNSSGALLWTALTSGRPIASIGADPAASATVSEFADKLVAMNLIIASDEPTCEKFEPVPLSEAPQIEVYDDLSDLIVADPIHDVDAEFGWPKAPNT